MSPQPGLSSLSDKSGPRSQNYADLNGCSSSEAQHGQSFSYDFVSDDGFDRDDTVLAIKLSLQSENVSMVHFISLFVKSIGSVHKYKSKQFTSTDHRKYNETVLREKGKGHSLLTG